MNTQDFLLEIGCDELPAKNLVTTVQQLSESFAKALQEAGLAFTKVKYYATPRRLAILVTDLASEQASQQLERQGPGVEAAFDKNGTPTLACIGFARSCGVAADDLQIKDTPSGKRVFCTIKQVGQQTLSLLATLIPELVYKLPLSKPMRWGTQTRAFIRPVQWVVALFGADVIETELFNIKASRVTYGHRFHHPARIPLNHAKDYARQLKEVGMVIAEVDERKNRIRQQIEEVCSPFGRALVDEKLLNEVTGLVEWPVVLVGRFNPDFLAVPPEALISSIKNHQKSFPVVNREGLLEPYFVIISNIASKDPKTIITGNERVINARLSDAAFFYKNDSNHSLQSFVDRLNTVVFQKQLGTLEDRSQRLIRLMQHMSKELKLNPQQAERSARLAKFDLMTEMVGEFPELQGIMGYYYAKQAKEPDAVARAIQEHYYPRYSQDRLPKEVLSAALALADRLDLLVGILGVNLTPSGEKDPYGLRRAGLGVVRLLIEKRLPLNLYQLLQQAQAQYPALPNKAVVDQAYDFIVERMRSWYLEQGISAEIFAAVAALRCECPLDFDQRLKAVQAFQALPESSSLAAANKRVGNILKKSAKEPLPPSINPALFESDIERRLANLLGEKMQQVTSLYQQSSYTEALSALASLKEPVDSFFDQVMIMVDDPKIRANRLALLTQLRTLFTQVADISLLP